MDRFVSPADVAGLSGPVVDCRFSLQDREAGRRAFEEGHVPGAVHLDLARDLSGPVEGHGGRHPLPAPADFAARLAALGIGRDARVLLYDDGNYLFAARAWWMLRALGFPEPRLLSGGYAAWLAAGGEPTRERTEPTPVASAPVPPAWPGACIREDLADLQAHGAALVDAREAARYRGEIEPIDPVAGHIPGALNRPWQAFVGEDGTFRDTAELQALWGDLAEVRPLVVYCGSGVSACVNLLSLAELGREDALLYAGSWSDWCSYL